MSRILKRKDVLQRVGISYPTLWRAEKAGDFPARRILTAGRVGWLESEVEAWIESRAAVVQKAGGMK